MAKEGDMKGTSDKRLVPELRFPEFEKDGEWHIEKLCNIANTFSGGTPSVNNRDYYNGVIPFIRSGEINNTITELSLTHLGVEKSSAKIVEKGTILYALYGATSGEVAISKIQGAINQAILAVIPNANYSTRYVYQFLKKEKTVITNHFLQGGQGNLSGAIINNLSIPFPSYIEQQKIAECLSLIDEEINAIKEKVEQLKIHKKGLLQKIFPVVGKFVPELRFPEFEKDCEWKEMSIADCCDVFTGGEAPKSISKEHNNIMKYPIYANGKDVYGYSDSYRIDKDAVCISSIGANAGAIFYYRAFFTPIIRLKVVIPKDNTVQTSYLYYFLTTRKIKGKKDAGIPNLNANDIKIILIMYPFSLAEQQKIAECLSSIDELISLYENKVILLEQHKKGLMQRLFLKQIN
ncbi:MAG: restriction endonuclease subunit S [Prevotella sp.]|nr:restriction endonuclease subunit S [Prevotella sp.]